MLLTDKIRNWNIELRKLLDSKDNGEVSDNKKYIDDILNAEIALEKLITLMEVGKIKI